MLLLILPLQLFFSFLSFDKVIKMDMVIVLESLLVHLILGDERCSALLLTMVNVPILILDVVRVVRLSELVSALE